MIENLSIEEKAELLKQVEEDDSKETKKSKPVYKMNDVAIQTMKFYNEGPRRVYNSTQTDPVQGT